MRIDREQLISINVPLVGFGRTRVFPLGAVMLLVTVGDYPQQITVEGHLWKAQWKEKPNDKGHSKLTMNS